jgi:hypothetical protein
MQLASARPYSLNSGVDLDGDGLATNDRLCAGVDPRALLQAQLDQRRLNPTLPADQRRTPTAVVLSLNPLGCQQTRVNSQRSGFIVRSDGTIEERSGRFFNTDVRISKGFSFGRRANVKVYADLFNLFNTENLSFTLRPEQSAANVAGTFMQPVSLYGPGFGPPVGRPFTASFGARVEF